MRVFPKFNQSTVCPICGTNKEGEAVLIAVEGTQDGSVCEALQMHLGCVNLHVGRSVNQRYLVMGQTFEDKRELTNTGGN